MSKIRWVAGILGVLLVAGCAVSGVDIPDENRPRQDVPLEETFRIPENLAPREQAAMELTRRGWGHLRQRQPDEAIRVLERALTLYPTGGPIYYYLSEAWLMNGNVRQAGNFNRLAELYTGRDPQWQQRIFRQRERITAPVK